MISDKERRNMASSFRHDAAYGEGSLSEWWGRLQFIVLDEDDFPNPREVFERLADLIDRPTCRNIGGEEGTNGEHYDFFCSACGYAGDFAEPNYCPNCGAEVVHDA